MIIKNAKHQNYQRKILSKILTKYKNGSVHELN